MHEEDKERAVRPERVDLDIILRRMKPETFPDVIDFGPPVGREVQQDTRDDVP